MKRIRASVYLTTTNSRQIQVLHRFARGIDLCGDISNPIWEDKIRESDVAVILWSPKIVENAPETNFRVEVFEHYRSQGKPVVIIEQPIIRHPKYKKTYLGFFQYRVGINDVTRLGDFANKNKPGDRWNALNLSLADWKRKGTDYVVCGQYPYDYSLGGLDLNAWAEATINTMIRSTTSPIKFKPHPLQTKLNLPLPCLPPDVELINEINWETTRATVTYSSGMSIDSLMNGVPCITCSERNFAWDHSTHDVSTPHQLKYPKDRLQLFHDFAYAQWSAIELEHGQCWKNLRTSFVKS